MVVFGKALSVAACNWKVLLKSLICQIVIYALCLAIASSFWGGAIGDLVALLQNGSIGDFLSGTIRSVADRTFDANAFAEGLGNLIRSVSQEVADIAAQIGDINVTALIIVVLVTMYRVMVALTDVTAECQLDEFMSSNASRPFLWFFCKKQGETWIFAILQMLFTVPLDALIILGCTGFYLMFSLVLSWWAIFPVALLAAVLYSARLTLFAFALPAVATTGLSTGKAFRYGLSKVFERFWSVFFKTFVVVIVMGGTVVLSALFIEDTVWASFVSVGLSFLLFFVLKSVNLCEFYEAHNLPYFSSRLAIEGTDHYERTHKQA